MNFTKYCFFSSGARRRRAIDCSQRTTHGSSVYFTNSRDCCSIFEKLDFSKSPTICGGTRKIRAISLIWNFRVSRNCACSGEMEIGVYFMPSSSTAILPLLAYTGEIDEQVARKELGSSLIHEFKLARVSSMHTKIE